jgi:hypothetical protein
VPWTLTVRTGPKVERSRFSELGAALDAAERRARELAGATPAGSVNAGYRQFDPAEQVAARIELTGPQRRLASVCAGIDVRGDGSTQAYIGRVRKAHVEQLAGETVCGALRRVVEARADGG